MRRDSFRKNIGEEGRHRFDRRTREQELDLLRRQADSQAASAAYQNTAAKAAMLSVIVGSFSAVVGIGTYLWTVTTDNKVSKAEKEVSKAEKAAADAEFRKEHAIKEAKTAIAEKQTAEAATKRAETRLSELTVKIRDRESELSGVNRKLDTALERSHARSVWDAVDSAVRLCVNQSTSLFGPKAPSYTVCMVNYVSAIEQLSLKDRLPTTAEALAALGRNQEHEWSEVFFDLQSPRVLEYLTNASRLPEKHKASLREIILDTSKESSLPPWNAKSALSNLRGVRQAIEEAFKKRYPADPK